MAITKRTTSYSVTVNTVAEETFLITDSDAAYTAIQDYKAKRFVKVPDGDNATLYIPYHSIVEMIVETETSTESVTDAFCVEG